MSEEIKNKDLEQEAEKTPAAEHEEGKASADKTAKAEASEEKQGRKHASKKDRKKETVSKADYEALQDKLSAAEEEIENLKNSRLRLMAEYDNFKRRTQKEKDRLYGDSLADVTAAWLPVLDNLDRAAASAEKLDDLSEKDAVKQVAEGIDKIRKQARQAMEKIGVKEIEALNKPFDPELHEAVMRVDGDDDGKETVVEVFAKGYIFEDRVIRHSVVKVAN